jgi:carbon storage regulator CsrA
VIGGADRFHRLRKVTVLGVHGTNVKLGFEVDPDVPVHRSEVWERIQADSQRKRPKSSPAAANEEMDRWEETCTDAAKQSQS